MEGAYCACCGRIATHYKKIIVAGDRGVGKTRLIKAFLELNRTPNYHQHFSNFASCEIVVDDSKFPIIIDELLCLDLRLMYGKFFEEADVLILCYAVDNLMSFQNVTGEWLNNFKRINPTAPIVIVATKCELTPEFRAISYAEGEIAARNMNAYKFLQVSSSTLENVMGVFVSAVRATLQIN